MNVTTGRERKLPPFVPGLAGAAALLLVAFAAVAATPPDPVALDRMRATASPQSLPRRDRPRAVPGGRWNRFRVVTTRSTFEFTSLHADSIGVLLQAAPRRPALLATPEARPDSERHVRWSEIERVEASRTHAGKGAVEGAIVGGIVGVGVAFLVASNVHDESAAGAIGVVPLGVVFGALAGAGFFGGSRWTRIYP